MSFPRYEDVIGFSADEELAGTDEERFIAVDFDSATFLACPFCSCILFAIVLVQLVKLELSAKQAELKG